MDTLKYNIFPHMSSKQELEVISFLSSNDWLPYPEHRYDVDNHQLYTDFSNVLFLQDGSLNVYSEKIEDVVSTNVGVIDENINVPDWVKEARFDKFKQTVPYTYFSGKLFSKRQIKPPFRLDAITETPCIRGHVPSIWVRNDLQGVTKELDMFETMLGKIFFTGHSGGHNYSDMERKTTILKIEPEGLQNISLEVEKNRADWFFNGRHVLKYKENWDVLFNIIVSLGVVERNVPEAEFTIKSLNLLT